MSTIVLLLLIALILFFVEIFAPGGILGFGGCVLICVAAALTFRDYGTWMALLVLIGGLGVGAVMFFFELHFLMHTRLGRSLFYHHGVQATQLGYAPEEASALVGQRGETVTRMTPTGKVRIGETIYPATSTDGYLAKGTTVVINAANSASIKVSPVHTL